MLYCSISLQYNMLYNVEYNIMSLCRCQCPSKLYSHLVVKNNMFSLLCTFKLLLCVISHCI